MGMFKTSFGEEVFKRKYAQNEHETWADRAKIIVNSVCGDLECTKNNLMEADDRAQLTKYIEDFKFMPGGRYIYYGGRRARMYNNCIFLHLLNPI